jgi:hypothetical protein
MHTIKFYYPGDDASDGYKPLSILTGGIIYTSVGAYIGAYQDYELIRRYMEEGLEAIQPKEEADEFTSDRALKDWMIKLTLGDFIAKVMDKRRANYKWPDEIEALCAADAREKGLLDKYDTSPVIATREKSAR